VATFTIQPLIICSFHILLLSTVSAAIIELADGQDGVGTASAPAHRPRARPLATPLDPQTFGRETMSPLGSSPVVHTRARQLQHATGGQKYLLQPPDDRHGDL
jgi:hypothetical protein